MDKDDLYELLKANKIEFKIFDHEPLYTVEDSKNLRGKIDGAHSKNLFLRDQKKNFFLLSLLEDVQIDLKKITEPLNSKKLSFAQPNYLKELMNIEPGSVSPFGLINDTEKKITFFLDQNFLDYEYVNFHPLSNTATVQIKPKELCSFIESNHKSVNFLDVTGFLKEA